MGQKIEKSPGQKYSWNQINQFHEKIFNFKLFPSSKIDFWPFLKWQKMEFGQIFFREIDLFDFTSFFGLDLFKFSGPLWEQRPPITGNVGSFSQSVTYNFWRNLHYYRSKDPSNCIWKYIYYSYKNFFTFLQLVGRLGINFFFWKLVKIF